MTKSNALYLLEDDIEYLKLLQDIDERLVNRDLCDNGRTYLTDAIKNNYPISVTFLLGKGANPNLIDAFGNAPLVLAVAEKRMEIIDILVTSKKLDLDQKDELGRTAVDIANKYGDDNCLKVLFINGASTSYYYEVKEEESLDDEEYYSAEEHEPVTPLPKKVHTEPRGDVVGEESDNKSKGGYNFYEGFNITPATVGVCLSNPDDERKTLKKTLRDKVQQLSNNRNAGYNKL